MKGQSSNITAMHWSSPLFTDRLYALNTLYRFPSAFSQMTHIGLLSHSRSDTGCENQTAI